MIALLVLGYLGCQSTKQPVPTETCGLSESGVLELEADYEALTEGVSTTPTTSILPEDTNGTLNMGLNPYVFPILSGDSGVFAAASRLGDGRVVAFSGQDFIGGQDRSTLLGEDSIDTLVTNAVQWTANQSSGSINVLAANERVASVLEEGGITNVTVTPVVETDGLWSIQDWSAAALSGIDVAVVQVNEWGTLYVSPDDVEALRDFVSDGGGIVIAGSAMHYDWWLSYSADDFIGDMILEGSGIEWNINSVPDVSTGTIGFDSLTPPNQLWCAYIEGDELSTSQFARMPSLFDAANEQGLDAELDVALTRLLEDTPSLPVPADDPQARLSANVASTLSPYQWPYEHPWTSTFPGSPSDTAITETITVSVDPSYTGAIPLGAYAPPGGIVTVTLPSDVDTTGLKIRIGELYDDLRSLDHIETWERAPNLRIDTVITDSQIGVGNPYGGSISLVIPTAFSGAFDVEVENAIRMPVYTKGLSTQEDFQTDLASGAPQAILQEKGRVRMVVASDAVAEVEDLEATVSFWSEFHEHHAELAQEPTERMYESHWIFDVQVGWGYANATNARITYPKLSEVWALRTQTGDEDWWLFGHELGHQFQTSNWSGGDITEVAVNLFTMYTLNDYIYGGGSYETIGFRDNTMDHAMLESYRWDSADLFGKLQLYRQLIVEFGWPTFQEAFASYYSEEYPVEQYGEFMDGFAIRYSSIVERDLVGFFNHWEYPMSSGAADTIEGFGYEPWLPEGWE